MSSKKLVSPLTTIIRCHLTLASSRVNSRNVALAKQRTNEPRLFIRGHRPLVNLRTGVDKHRGSSLADLDGVASPVIGSAARAGAVVALGIEAAGVTLVILAVRALDRLQREELVPVRAAAEEAVIAHAVGAAISLDIAPAVNVSSLRGITNEQDEIAVLAAAKSGSRVGHRMQYSRLKLIVKVVVDGVALVVRACPTLSGEAPVAAAASSDMTQLVRGSERIIAPAGVLLA